MYHIALIIAAISSQDQIANIKQQFEKQIEGQGSKQKSVDISQVKNQANNKISNIGVVNKPESQLGNGDIISQLKQEVIAQEDATKPDLESLGLDPIDDIANIKKNSGGDFLTGNLTNITPTNTGKNSNKNNNSLTEAERKVFIPTTETPKTKKQETPITTPVDISNKQPANKPTNGTVTNQPFQNAKPLIALTLGDNNPSNNIDSPQSRNVNAKSDSKEIEVVTKKFISKIIEKPVAEIKKFLNKKSDDASSIKVHENMNDKKEITKEQPVKNKKHSSTHQKKVPTTTKDIKEFKLKEKDRLKKLTELRQKYLQNSDENGYYKDMFKLLETCNNSLEYADWNIVNISTTTSESDKCSVQNKIYSNSKEDEHINTIIPKRKIPPKFISDSVPPPLLNRFKGQENKHHPFYISYSEKVNLMFQAIKDGRIDDFNSILNLVEDPNIKNSLGDTLLTFAILMRKYGAISSLIVKGADPNLANNLGYTPLNIAIEMGDYKAASMLIDVGNAKINFIDDLGVTYLMQATRVIIANS